MYNGDSFVSASGKEWDREVKQTASYFKPEEPKVKKQPSRDLPSEVPQINAPVTNMHKNDVVANVPATVQPVITGKAKHTVVTPINKVTTDYNAKQQKNLTDEFNKNHTTSYIPLPDKKSSAPAPSKSSGSSVPPGSAHCRANDSTLNHIQKGNLVPC